MEPQKNAFRHVVKATSLFGDVQVITILISIVRSKIIALLIGPTGMGIASLLNTTLNLVDAATNLGLNRSAVKDISYAKNNDSPVKTVRTVRVLQRLVWFTGLGGALLMGLTSPLLSELAFGNSDYTFAFIWISIALLFKQLANSNLAILQGLQKLRSLAKANVLGSLFGLITTVPLYYFFGIEGIVPAIIIAAIVTFLVTSFFQRKIELRKTDRLTNKQTFSEGKEMIRLGVTLSVSGIISLIAAYAVQIYISNTGGVDEVGFYNAGVVILNTYVGLVFNAMATDYFPRLSGVIDSLEKVKDIVFEQAFVAILLMLPIVVIFVAFAPFFITLLYSQEFSPTVQFVAWGILGMMFKAVSFSMGYIIIAKGDSKVFITTAIVFNIVLVAMNVAGYSYWGLEGLGISYFLYFIIHFVAIWVLTNSLYGFRLKSEFYAIFIAGLLLCGIAFSLTFVENVLYRYVGLSIVVLISIVFSLYQLDKKVGIRELIQTILKRKKK